MPFRVTQWPYSPDPRPPSFNVIGWDFGQVPPYKWHVSAVGANGPWVDLVEGWTVDPTVVTASPGDYQGDGPASGGLDAQLIIEGFQGEDIIIVGHSIAMILIVNSPGQPQGFGSVQLTFPTAIQKHSFDSFEIGGSPSDFLPNPPTITPLLWSA